jgi:hypothetical protein
MTREEEILKIELLRQKNIKRLERQRKFREFQPERFDEFQFAKCIGFDKAMQCVMQILGYKKSDFDTIDL